jgi:hypothetical protein
MVLGSYFAITQKYSDIVAVNLTEDESIWHLSTLFGKSTYFHFSEAVASTASGTLSRGYHLKEPSRRCPAERSLWQKVATVEVGSDAGKILQQVRGYEGLPHPRHFQHRALE